MSVLAAAQTLGAEAGWSLTNLHMQKVLYVAQMLHMGRTGRPLFNDRFEAWEYGPVVPALYRHAKVFKNKPVTSLSAGEAFHRDSAEAQTICDAYTMTKHMTPGQLVSYLHQPGGAWDQAFRPGELGCTIPQAAILADWERYMRPTDNAVAWAERMADELEEAPARYIQGERERAFRARVLGEHIH